jgi:hypothetical protein
MNLLEARLHDLFYEVIHSHDPDHRFEKLTQVIIGLFLRSFVLH